MEDGNFRPYGNEVLSPLEHRAAGSRVGFGGGYSCDLGWEGATKTGP